MHFSNLPDIFIEGVKFIVLQASPLEHIYHCCLYTTKKKKRDRTTSMNNSVIYQRAQPEQDTKSREITTR